MYITNAMKTQAQKHFDRLLQCSTPEEKEVFNAKQEKF